MSGAIERVVRGAVEREEVGTTTINDAGEIAVLADLNDESAPWAIVDIDQPTVIQWTSTDGVVAHATEVLACAKGSRVEESATRLARLDGRDVPTEDDRRTARVALGVGDE